MNFLHAIIFGFVEGITEFLPVSSTGHLIVTSHLLGLADSDFIKSFEITIQVGAILAVVALYWRSFLVEFDVLKKVIAGFIPTGIVGFILYKFIKQYLLGNTSVVIVSLFIGGLILIAFEKMHDEKKASVHEVKQISYRQAMIIGLVQSISVIPGVSRSAATIVGGMTLGLSRKAVVEFSFLLAVPTMLAASGYDILKSASGFSMDQFGVMAVGFVVSFIVALLSLRWLLSFVKKHTFVSFGIYRILAAGVFWFLLK
jgi:undecaprenyl-diphosphatase